MTCAGSDKFGEISQAGWRFHDNTCYPGGILTNENLGRRILSASGLPAEAPITPRVEITNGPTATYGLPPCAESLADRIAIVRIRTRDFLTSASRRSVNTSRRAVTNLRNRALRTKNERPMAFLGLIAGSAFALGMTLRIWRSQR
jgi:hypothetical protein